MYFSLTYSEEMTTSETPTGLKASDKELIEHREVEQGLANAGGLSAVGSFIDRGVGFGRAGSAGWW